MKYSTIMLLIQLSALILQLNDIGKPYTNIVAVLGVIPVLLLLNMEK